MPLSNTDLFVRLAVAIVMGGAIGWEREIRGIPAGLRTHLLVSLASATFALVSFYVAYYQSYTTDGIVRVDGARIASNIVVGMGFLGGGAILRSGLSVRGLTTAASLWLTAAIGLAAGGGMLLLAVTATVVSLFTLSVLRFTIEMPRKRHAHLHVRIDLEGDFISRAALIDFLRPSGANVSGVDYRRDLQTNRSRMEMDVMLRDDTLEEPLMKRLEELPGARRVKVERGE
jgi:putative Mg2+ transporter-C (MgtC) family protein